MTRTLPEPILGFSSEITILRALRLLLHHFRTSPICSWTRSSNSALLRTCLLIGAIDVALSISEQVIGAEGLRKTSIGRKVEVAEFCSAVLMISIFLFAAYKLASNSVRNTELQQLPITLEEWLLGISAPLLLLMAILILTKLIPIPIIALYVIVTEEVQFWEDKVDAALRVSTSLGRDLFAPILWDFSLWLILALFFVRFGYVVTRRQMVLPGPWAYSLAPLMGLLALEGVMTIGLKVSFIFSEIITDLGHDWARHFLNQWVHSFADTLHYLFLFVFVCLILRIRLPLDLARFDESFFPRE